MTTISVIIPTYNRIESLKRAVSSVVNQTYKEFEIVIVDDNTDQSISDSVADVCKDFQQKANIRICRTNGGIGGGRARNLGCQNAVGEYLAFLDDDDIYVPDKLEKQLKFTRDNDLDMSFQDVIWLNEKDEVVEYRSFSYITDCSNDNLLKQHLLHNIAPTSIYFIKRDKFLETDGFGDVKVGQDIYLMFSCIERGFKIGYMQGAFVRQYLHRGDRISKGTKKIAGENWWYKEKRKYLHVLNRKEKRFFKFRHYMILLFASLRSGYYFRALYYGTVGFLVSPSDSVREGYKYLAGKV
jgi:glycosyltransferase involved in cell wall biosynthesis